MTTSKASTLLRVSHTSDNHFEFLYDAQNFLGSEVTTDNTNKVLSYMKEGFSGTFCGTERPDIIVLGGDMTNFVRAEDFYSNLKVAIEETGVRDIPIVQVLGNHEYYGTPVPAPEVLAEYKKLVEEIAPSDNFHLLEDESVVLPIRGQNVKVIGSTMWTRLPVKSQVVAKQFLNDFHMNGLTVDWYMGKQEASAAFIERELEATLQDESILASIVVTHHAPSAKSIANKYKNTIHSDTFNRFYYSDLDYLMHRESAPLFWLHGHTHTEASYKEGNTLVSCFPFGYPGENYKIRKNAYRNLVTEIGDLND